MTSNVLFTNFTNLRECIFSYYIQCMEHIYNLRAANQSDTDRIWEIIQQAKNISFTASFLASGILSISYALLLKSYRLYLPFLANHLSLNIDYKE